MQIFNSPETLGTTRLFSKDYSAYKTAPSVTPSMLHHDRHHYLYSTSHIGYRSRVGLCYKMCSLMYRVNHNTTYPNCVPCSDTRLRSTTRGNYVIPRTHRHLANRAFAVGTLCQTVFMTPKVIATFYPNL